MTRIPEKQDTSQSRTHQPVRAAGALRQQRERGEQAPEREQSDADSAHEPEARGQAPGLLVEDAAQGIAARGECGDGERDRPRERPGRERPQEGQRHDEENAVLPTAGGQPLR